MIVEKNKKIKNLLVVAVLLFCVEKPWFCPEEKPLWWPKDCFRLVKNSANSILHMREHLILKRLLFQRSNVVSDYWRCVCLCCFSPQERTAESHSVQKSLKEEKRWRSARNLLQRPEGEEKGFHSFLSLFALIPRDVLTNKHTTDNIYCILIR